MWVYHGEALSDDESRSGEHALNESDGEEGLRMSIILILMRGDERFFGG
jgi:hypothetical protein